MEKRLNPVNTVVYTVDEPHLNTLVKPIELELQDPENETYDLDERVRKFCEKLNKPQTVHLTQDMFNNWATRYPMIRHKPTL